MTRCVNCGLPLQPERNQANCPRCGSPLNAMQQEVPQQQFGQAGWSNMGGMPQQNPWGQTQTPAPQQNSWGQTPAPGPYNQYPQQNEGWQNGTGMSGFNGNGMAGFNNDMGSGLQQTPLTPQRPTPPTKKKTSPAMRIALICFILSIVIVGFVGVLAAFNSSKGNSPTASSNTPQVVATSTTAPSPTTASATATATATASASPTATGTAYPGQQYISNAQMMSGASDGSKPNQPSTTFTISDTIYVSFSVNPPGTGGEVCSQWYLNGNEATHFSYPIKPTTHSLYLYANYGSAGPAYVQLYWASDKSCSDQILAQQVNFTVTAS
jgi:hypothetical protein